MFRSRDLSFPPFKYVLSFDIEGFVLGLWPRFLFSWLELWNEIYPSSNILASIFSYCKRLEVISSLVPFRYIIIEKQA